MASAKESLRLMYGVMIANGGRQTRYVEKHLVERNPWCLREVRFAKGTLQMALVTAIESVLLILSVWKFVRRTAGARRAWNPENRLVKTTFLHARFCV